jgi:hypothetical protein
MRKLDGQLLSHSAHRSTLGTGEEQAGRGRWHPADSND